MTEEQKIMMANKPEREENEGWSTTTKIALGLGVVALTGAAIYFGMKRPVWSKVV